MITPDAIIAAAISAIWGFCMPLSPYIGLTLGLCMADLYTGIRASKKPVHSRGLRRSVEKFVLYVVAILLAEGMGHVFFASNQFLTYAVAFIVCSIEFKSNLENISIITGQPLWRQLKAAVADKLKINSNEKR
jgi:hypothetical protein